MNLSRLLLIHAVITFAAGVVLIVQPELIPGTVNISLSPAQYLLCYFLGAAEIALAFLSFRARKITDVQSLQLIVHTFIVFHLATAAVELLALAQGGSARLLVNVALRVLISVLFLYFLKARKQNS